MSRTGESGLDAAFAGLSLDRLRSFVETVDAGGFAKAAPGDPSRQSQLSRQVREIERALGVAVLRRAGRSVVPTDAGKRLRALVGDLALGLGSVRASPSTKPALRLAAGDSVLRWLVVPALGSLGSDPPARVSLFASSQVLDELADGRAQLGLLRARTLPGSGGFVTASCGAITFALFVPRALTRTKTDLEDILARVPLVDVSADPFGNIAMHTKIVRCKLFRRPKFRRSAGKCLRSFVTTEIGSDQ